MPQDIGAIVAVLTTIIGIAKQLGWFTEAKWNDELLGDYSHSPRSGHGGILEKLENATGLSYPDLWKIRTEVVDAFNHWQYALPWDKQKTAKAYIDKANAFIKAVTKEAEAYKNKLAGVPLETFRKYLLPVGLAGGITIIAILIWKFKK